MVVIFMLFQLLLNGIFWMVSGVLGVVQFYFTVVFTCFVKGGLVGSPLDYQSLINSFSVAFHFFGWLLIVVFAYIAGCNLVVLPWQFWIFMNLCHPKQSNPRLKNKKKSNEHHGNHLPPTHPALPPPPFSAGGTSCQTILLQRTSVRL